MMIASWNVNSVRTRLERALAWLEKRQPDVVCMQELKAVDADFPFAEFEAAGYHAAVWGQKTYNGVAILARSEPAAVSRGFEDGVDDPEARFIRATINGVHVICLYVPNGRTVGSEKYEYKITWLGRLRAYLDRHFEPGDRVVLCGDFNVATDDKEVARPEAWASTVLYHPDMRKLLAELKAWGVVDVLRKHHPEGGTYTWWDYRMLAFPKNDGLKIDHILATKPLAEVCSESFVDRDERKGKKPSDHAPVLAVFEV